MSSIVDDIDDIDDRKMISMSVKILDQQIAELNRLIHTYRSKGQNGVMTIKDLERRITAMRHMVEENEKRIGIFESLLLNLKSTNFIHCPKMDRANRETCDDCPKELEPSFHCCQDRECSMDELREVRK